MKGSIFHWKQSYLVKPVRFSTRWLLHKSDGVHHTRDLQMFWQRSWGLGYFLRHLEGIWRSLAPWYNFPINSKLNIREFCQTFAQIFKREKITCNSQWSSLHMNKNHCRSTIRYHSWSIIVFSLYKWSLWRISSNAKLFADNISLFSVIHGSQTSVNNLNPFMHNVPKRLTILVHYALKGQQRFRNDT